jgi:hypothetical protein
LDHPDKDLDWNAISANPNVTWKLVETGINIQWNYRALSGNKMTESERKRCQELIDVCLHPSYIQLKIEKYGCDQVLENA